MRTALAAMCLVALAGGAGLVGIGCSNSRGGGKNDAGLQPDAPGTTGGGVGGELGTGGRTSAGGAGGSLPGTGGIAGMTGSGGDAGLPGTGGSATGGGRGPGTGRAGGTLTLGVGGTAGTGGTTASDGGGAATGGGTGTDGGEDSTYSGCTYIGGIDRMVVAKFDPQRDLCTLLAFNDWPSPAALDAAPGLTVVESYWGLEVATMWTPAAHDCMARPWPTNAAKLTSATGRVLIALSGQYIDIDAVLVFQPADGGPAETVEMKAQHVDARNGC